MSRSCRIIIAIILVILTSEVCCAATGFIENISRTRKSNGYLFKINYQTTKEWTDGVVFKLFCSFSKGCELSFTSPGFNNVKRGWHDTEIQVPKVYRERYGYIQEYRIEMYQNGILISIKSM